MVQSVERRMVRREEGEAVTCAICGFPVSKRVLLGDDWRELCFKCNNAVKRADDRAVVS